MALFGWQRNPKKVRRIHSKARNPHRASRYSPPEQRPHTPRGGRWGGRRRERAPHRLAMWWFSSTLASLCWSAMAWRIVTRWLLVKPGCRLQRQQRQQQQLGRQERRATTRPLLRRQQQQWQQKQQQTAAAAAAVLTPPQALESAQAEAGSGGRRWAEARMSWQSAAMRSAKTSTDLMDR